MTSKEKKSTKRSLKERDDTIFAKDVKRWMLSGNDINITFKDGNELVGAIYEHRKDSEDKKAECFLCEDLTADYTGDYFIVEVYNGKIYEIKFQSYDWLEHYMDDSYDLMESKKSAKKSLKEEKVTDSLFEDVVFSMIKKFKLKKEYDTERPSWTVFNFRHKNKDAQFAITFDERGHGDFLYGDVLAFGDEKDDIFKYKTDEVKVDSYNIEKECSNIIADCLAFINTNKKITIFESKKSVKKSLKEENNRQKVTEGIMKYFDNVFPLIEKDDTFRFSMYTKKDVMIGIEVFKDYIFVGLFNLDGKNNLDESTEIPRETYGSVEDEILYDSDAIFEYLEEYKLV